MRSRSLLLIIVACLFVFLSVALLVNHNARTHSSQLLEQAVTIILTSGYIELEQIDHNTVASRRVTSAGTTKTVDRHNCIFSNEGGEYFFNNIMVDDIVVQIGDGYLVSTTRPRTAFDGPIFSGHQEYTLISTMVRLHGDDKVFCSSSPEIGCASEFYIVGWGSSALERMKKAIDYVYSNFCTGAKSKTVPSPQPLPDGPNFVDPVVER